MLKSQTVEKTIDIYPAAGIITALPPEKIPVHASPDMENCVIYNGRLRKRPGFVQFPSGAADFGVPVLAIASIQDTENATHLFAITQVGLRKWNVGTQTWDSMSGPALTGSNDRLFWYEVSQNTLVFSQGVDQVMKMPFTGTTYAILNADCPASRYGTRCADRLLIAHTLEGGSQRPFRIRRPVAADHTNWTGVGSGFSDIDEFPYHIRGLRKLGTRAVAYTEGAMWVGTRTGYANAPIGWEPIVSESGLYAPYTLCGRRNAHFGLGNEDFFEFDGSSYNPIGASIRDEVFGTLNAAKVHIMFAVVMQDTQEAMFFVSTGSSDAPDRVWVYNWQRQIWYRWTVSGHRCAATHKFDSNRSWDNLTGTWDSNTIEWDSFALQSYVKRLLTGNDNGRVYEWSLEYYSDDGAEIRSYWSSKDFTSCDFSPEIQGKMITIKDVTVRYQDLGAVFDLNLYYSTDGGSTWLGPTTRTAPAGTSGLRSLYFTEQITGNRIRFKLEQNSASQSFVIHSIHPRLELRDYVVVS